MSARKSEAETPGGPRLRPGHTRSPKGLEEVLSHAQEETRRKLELAMHKKKRTGQTLTEVLRQDVSRGTFKNIWDFLNKPTEEQPVEAQPEAPRKVKDVLREHGWVGSDELREPGGDAEGYDPAIAQALVSSGAITEEQIRVALAEHARSGLSVWRIMINQGWVAPKHIADARRYGVGRPQTVASHDTLREMLLRTELVSQEQCDAAIEEHERTGNDVLQMLLDKGVAAKPQLGAALAKELDVPYADLQQTEIDLAVLEILPEHLATENRMIPLSVTEDSVRLAMASPGDKAARDLVHMMTNKEVEPVFAFERDVLVGIRRHYAAVASAVRDEPASKLSRLRARLHGSAVVDETMVSMAENVGVISLVASIIEGAVNSRATDIHLEPQSYGLRVRYRIDGMLYDIMNLPRNLEPEVISRVKVLASMDITERRHPQDGHFTIDVADTTYDLRVATLPTIMGEKLVLRLLNPEDIFMGFREIGLESGQLKIMEKAISQPYGMILVTGPIGSGKTTTLYAALSETDIFARNVVTIEDPVEYQLPGINQVQVDLRVDRTFANMLRSVVRQDANVMMVGEIRDEDTARVAVRAAMTGHQVFSTLHTNDAAGAIDTLLHLKVPAFLITSALVVVVAQRLVRKVCPACREEFTPEPAMLRAVGVTKTAASKITFYRPVGCEACYETGYKGRTGIFEMLTMDNKMKKLIINGATHDEITRAAKSGRMVTLMKSGLASVKAGVTTIEELLRVTTV